MIKLNLKNLKIHLDKFTKIIVTGPPRAGTTISGMVIASELGYKFIDESWYDANNPEKFKSLFSIARPMVIHTTAFIRDLHRSAEFFKLYNVAVTLVLRNVTDIMESIENTRNFDMGISTSAGLMTQVGDEEYKILLKHYDPQNDYKDQCLPEIIYNHFETYKHKFERNQLFKIRFDDLRSHKLFVKKDDRRKNFKHIKQVKIDDPYYLTNQKGVMVL